MDNNSNNSNSDNHNSNNKRKSRRLSLAIQLNNIYEGTIDIIENVILGETTGITTADSDNVLVDGVIDSTKVEELYQYTWQAIDSTSIWIILSVTLFWSLLFFDMIADKYGNINGLITIIIFISSIIIIIGLFELLIHNITYIKQKDSNLFTYLFNKQFSFFYRLKELEKKLQIDVTEKERKEGRDGTVDNLYLVKK